MTVSVIIPTFNRAAAVIEAIASVRDQTVPPHEIIVVDDGSTDATAEALAAFTSDIVVVRQPNSGVSAARNAGLRRASGKWVAFLDSDDVWQADWLAALATTRAAVPDAGVVVADLVFEGPGYERRLFEIRRLAFPHLPATRVANPLPYAIGGLSLIAAAARRDWIVQAGGFNNTYRMYEDLDLLTRLALAGPWAFTPTVAARAKRRSEQAGHALTAIAAKNQALALTDLATIFTVLNTDTRVTPGERKLIQRTLSGAHLGAAKALTAAGQRDAALTPLLASARTHPSVLQGWTKAALFRLLGPRLYYRVMAGKRGFHREDYEI